MYFSKEKLYNTPLRLFLTVEVVIVIVYGIIRGWAAMGSPYPPAVYYVKNIEPFLIEPAKFGYVWAMAMLFLGLSYQVSTK